MTHASGKYVPPPSTRPRPTTGQPDLFKNPYLQQPSATSSHRFPVGNAPAYPPITGPRLPRPRAPSAAKRTSVQTNDTRNPSPPSRLQGSFRTSQLNEHRKALPPHLQSSTRPSHSPEPKAERFKIADSNTKSKFHEVKRPEVANFAPPKKSGVVVDFFGDGARGPKGFLESLGRAQAAERSGSPSRTSGTAGGQKRRSDSEALYERATKRREGMGG
jgi:hypothetical protein